MSLCQKLLDKADVRSVARQFLHFLHEQGIVFEANQYDMTGLPSCTSGVNVISLGIGTASHRNR
jgi:hypothetical protein